MVCEAADATPETRARMQHQLMHDKADDLLKLLQYFRHLLICVTDPPFETLTEEIVVAGCLPKFVNILHEDRLDLQIEAAWVLGNIAAGVDSLTRAVAEAGAVAPMVRLLSCEDRRVQEVAARGLANIACLPVGRDQALTHDVLTPLLPLLKKDDILPDVSCLMKNLCMGRNPPPLLSSLRPCLPTLTRLVSHSSDFVSEDACDALAALVFRHGSRLGPSLEPSFLNEVLNLEKANPERTVFATLAGELEKAGLTPPPTPTDATLTQPLPSRADVTQVLPTQTAVTQSLATQAALTPPLPSQKDANSKSTKEARPKSPQDNVRPSVASRAPGRRRPRSVSPSGVSTRSTPKRAKTSSSATVCITPRKPRTRATSKRFLHMAPNHSASHISQKKEELLRAVEEGELDRVEHLVHNIAPSVTTGTRGYTLLHVAAENNHTHVAQFLLQFISPNVVNNDGQTPAHVAAIKGHTQVLNVLLSDSHMNRDKRDLSGNTYTHWLADHLLQAVLQDDVARARSLLTVGADADQKVRGTLARQLQITSFRHLASVLHQESMLRMFDAKRRSSKTLETESSSFGDSASFCILPEDKCTFTEPVVPSVVKVRGADVYNMDTTPRGYVSILSYNTFHDRQDLHLEGSKTDAYNLAHVFHKMGYEGHAHFSLTASQTREKLALVRDKELLERAGCAIFVISSHGEPGRHFLTKDMQTIDIQWVLDFFKDSQCPHLKNKPKLFIWDLYRGHQEEDSRRGKTQEVCGRVDEPLRDVVCLDSSSGGFTWHTFSEEGTPFIGALCSTLARHASTKELTELYREFLKEYATAAPEAVPKLTNYGFNKKFYFH